MQAAQTCRYLLENVVRVNDSVYGWDKSVKIMAYAFGLASNFYSRTRGPDSDLAGTSSGHLNLHIVHIRFLRLVYAL